MEDELIKGIWPRRWAWLALFRPVPNAVETPKAHGDVDLLWSVVHQGRKMFKKQQGADRWRSAARLVQDAKFLCGIQL
jgi:hypothetical protein